ncbi:MAG TPA: hypothetical protein DHW78_00615, partial [Ruminococcaceae bacterium]|nr:hypothetical protein [Oscillospiraceae bacterium]
MTVEELQIVISAKTQGVRDKIDKLKKSISDIQPKKMPQLNVSTNKAQGNLKKLQSEVERTQTKIQELSGRFANIQQARDDYLYGKYSGVFPKGVSQDDIASTFERDPGFQKYKEQLDSLNAQMAPLNERLAETKAQMAEVGSAASSAAPETERLGRSARTAGSHLQSAGRSSGYFGRMVKSMMLSMVLYQGVSFVAKSIAEGFQNMALASGQANATMSALAANGLYLKNSFASAVYPIVQALTPAFTVLSNAIAGVLQKIGMFFAALNGKKYITVAKRAQVDYAKTISQSGNNALQVQQKQAAAAEAAAAKSARVQELAAEKTTRAQESAAAKQSAAEKRVQKQVAEHQAKVDKLKKSLMSFDELNVLNKQEDTWQEPTVPDYTSKIPNYAASVQPVQAAAPPVWNGMPSPMDTFQQKAIPSKISDLANKIKQILNDLKMFLIPGMLLVIGTILCLTG